MGDREANDFKQLANKDAETRDDGWGFDMPDGVDKLKRDLEDETNQEWC